MPTAPALVAVVATVEAIGPQTVEANAAMTVKSTVRGAAEVAGTTTKTATGAGRAPATAQHTVPVAMFATGLAGVLTTVREPVSEAVAAMFPKMAGVTVLMTERKAVPSTGLEAVGAAEYVPLQEALRKRPGTPRRRLGRV